MFRSVSARARADAGPLSGGVRSLAAAQLGEDGFEWNAFSSFTLRDGFEKHSFSLSIRFERFFLGKENRNRCSFRKLRVGQLDVPVYDSTRGNSHLDILADACAATLRRGGKGAAGSAAPLSSCVSGANTWPESDRR